MDKIFRQTYFPFLVVLAFFSKVALFSPEINYIEKTGKKRLHTSWKIREQTENGVWIEGSNEELLTNMLFSKNWELQKYQIASKTKDTNYELRKQDSAILAQGKIDGKKMMESHEIQRNSHWVEHFGFGLLPFLESSDAKFYFFCLNPNDFSLVPMIATKEKEETLKIGFRKKEAIKIKVTLTGMKSMFWSAYLWYDKKSLLFLKYEGNSGPNTPLTTILYENGSVKIP